MTNNYTLQDKERAPKGLGFIVLRPSGHPGTWDGRRHGAGWRRLQGRLRGPEKWTSFVVGERFRYPSPQGRGADRGGDPPPAGRGPTASACRSRRADAPSPLPRGRGRAKLAGRPESRRRVAEAEERLTITRAPRTSAADERSVRRRGSG